MDLFEDCPCDLKCNPNCAANNDEQLQNIVQHHDASPLPRLRTGEQTISFYVPRTLAGGKPDHRLCRQHLNAAVKRHNQYNIKCLWIKGTAAHSFVQQPLFIFLNVNLHKTLL